MRSKALHALADMAAKNGQGASDILREFAIYEQTNARVEELRREMEGWQRSADLRGKQRAEEVHKREGARLALGDGWHPLKSGGAVLLEGGKPVRLRDGGEHTTERRTKTFADAQALGFEWLSYSKHDNDEWSKGGEAPVGLDDSPQF